VTFGLARSMVLESVAHRRILFLFRALFYSRTLLCAESLGRALAIYYRRVHAASHT